VLRKQQAIRVDPCVYFGELQDEVLLVQSSDHLIAETSGDRKRGRITSVEEGLARAQELAGEGEIGVTAGEVGAQALSLGLIDYVAIDVVPVVFGRGKLYFGTLTNGHVMLEDPDVVIQGDGVLHLRYPVRRESTAASL
jgi:hypothetical protein